ncbi:hypothetical protein [Helicobacter bilis]|uniref:hypothetical protein n=1 Tax=Helicobacter bilis TaxID=37372 RepID=UPI0018F80442|nr:hypothetical protein [Helicobacter bilis]
MKPTAQPQEPRQIFLMLSHETNHATLYHKKRFKMIQTKNLTLKKFQENFDFQNLSFL